MEEFINFELAIKLKELGYNKPFFFFYRTDDKLIHHAMVNNPLIYGKEIDDEVVIAPTVSQIVDWLRKTKKIYVSVEIEREDWFEYKIVQTIKGTRGNSTRVYKTYDDAILAGIEYVINNLI